MAEEAFGAAPTEATSLDQDGGRNSEFKQKDTWFLQAFVPSEDIDWEAKAIPRAEEDSHSTAAAAGGQHIDNNKDHGSTDKVEYRLEQNFWTYTDPEVESEFERFLIGDQLTLPIALAYSFGNMLTPISASLASESGIPLFDFLYFMLMGVLSSIILTIDQIFYFKASLRKHPRRVQVRLLAATFTAFQAVYSAGWINTKINAECTGSFRGGGDFHKERVCTERLEPLTFIPFAGIVLFMKVKLHVALFFSMLCFVSQFITAFIYGSQFFTGGARHGAVWTMCYVVVPPAYFYLAVLRYKSYRRQFESTIDVTVAKKRTLERQAVVDTLLESLVPEVVLPRLMDSEVDGGTGSSESLIDVEPEASVLFSDIAGFTKWSSSRSPGQVVAMLNTLVSQFDEAAAQTKVSIGGGGGGGGGIERVKTIGDAYWAVCGMPEYVENHSYHLCCFAQQMISIVRQSNGYNPEWRNPGGSDLQIRVGVHTGPLHGAILGMKQVAYEVFGSTNDIASLAEQQGVPGQVCVTQAVVDSWSDNNAFFSLKTVAHKEVQSVSTGRMIKLHLLASSDGRADGDGEGNSSGGSHSRKGLLMVPADGQSQRSSHYGADGTSRRSNQNAVVRRAETKKAKTEQVRREKFLASLRQRRVNAEESFRGANDSIIVANTWAEKQDKLTERKYSFCCLGLLDEAYEAEFEEFVLHKTANFRFAGRVVLLETIFILLLMLFIDGKNLSAATALTWALAFGCAFVPVFLASPWIRSSTNSPRRKNIQLTEFFFGIAAALLVQIGALFMTYTHNRTETVNFAVNSPSGLFILTFLPPMLCSIATPWTALPTGAFVFFVLWLPSTALTLMIEPANFRGNTLGTTISVLCSTFLLFLMEKMYRQMFLDKTRTDFLANEAAQHSQTSEGVLQKLVPSHVIPDLMSWISSGMAAEKSVAKEYSKLCIAFLKLSPNIGRLPQGKNIDSGDASAAAVAHEWLLFAHRGIDDMLGSSNFQLLTKIKTVGDLVMLAGPFTSEEENQQKEEGGQQEMFRRAAIQMVNFSLQVSERLGLDVHAGLHVGPVMAAVLGLVRPMFDVFGDSVNTASRVLSSSSNSSSATAAAGEGGSSAASAACSRGFVEALTPGVSLGEVGGEGETIISGTAPIEIKELGIVLGAEKSVDAKGKGTLFIRSIRATVSQ